MPWAPLAQLERQVDDRLRSCVSVFECARRVDNRGPLDAGGLTDSGIAVMDGQTVEQGPRVGFNATGGRGGQCMPSTHGEFIRHALRPCTPYSVQYGLQYVAL